MKTISRRSDFVINFILVAVIVVVGVVSFLPEHIIPIYTGSQFSAIYKGNSANKNVSLMFNVYENTETVNKIIDCLDSYNIKATFFVGGCWADDNMETLKKIVNSGHELSNHGYFHKNHKKLSYELNKQEIMLAGNVIEALSGYKPDLFAPPSGSFSETTLEVAKDLGYKVIMWSKDTIDWRDSDDLLVFERATKNLTNGDLILMHPEEHTLKALPNILDYYKSVGYNVVTVSENIG